MFNACFSSVCSQEAEPARVSRAGSAGQPHHGPAHTWHLHPPSVRRPEIGWMVLPRYQGRGLGGRAARALLERARDEDRWGEVHAFPATTNAASNGICRSLGFRFVGEREVEFAGRTLRTHHWAITPRADLTPG
ncbi:GNAT family N-acetyltransferase [Streptomyces sp. NPDC006700]|uniref:GNAT family N-acetyltransferase n=1 Tax=unclassified Streptomyces TaxID=2593676 RepID=UPI0033CAC4A8